MRIKYGQSSFWEATTANGQFTASVLDSLCTLLEAASGRCLHCYTGGPYICVIYAWGHNSCVSQKFTYAHELDFEGTLQPLYFHSAASEFSSMMKEMESHSKKAQVAPSPKHTVLRYSQQSLSSKQRESRESHPESSVDEDGRRGNHDDFTAAVDALSKLNISAKSETQAATQAGTQQPTARNERTTQREFSPAVAAVFDAVSENQSMNTPYDMSKLEPNEKAMMEEHRQSPQGKMPDMFQKLMHPPPQRGPLLPNPVYYHQPRVPIRGTCSVLQKVPERKI